jgi:hypothetical protein
MGVCVCVCVQVSGLVLVLSSVCLCVAVRTRVCACEHIALLIQHATRRHIAICSLSGSTIFSTLSHKRYDFRKNVTAHKMYILIFSTTFISNISYSKKNSARYFHKIQNAFV